MFFVYRIFFPFIFVFSVASGFSQLPSDTDSSLLINLLLEKPENFGTILSNPDKYRVQIIYSQIDKNNGKITFKHYIYRHKPHEYFYPASIVKLPLSLLCLEKINQLKSEGVTKDSHLEIDSSHSCQMAVMLDYTSADSFPTIANYIKKAMIVSDNEAYNHLYEFMGQSYINSRLFSLGYQDARIISRFSSCDSTDNKFTNGFVFYNHFGKIIWYQPPVENTAFISTPYPGMQVGEGNMVGKEIFNGPKDFSRKNCMPLDYVHNILIRMFYPRLFNAWERLNVAEKDLDFLKKQMSSTPSESGITEYTDKKKYWDTYTNYLYYGNEPGAVILPDLKIYNIVGLSYGFAIDCAYFSDTTHNVQFFLSAVIYANTDGIIGDDKYDYATIAMPFMKELGKTIYDYETNRAK